MEELFKQFIAVNDAKTEKLGKEVGELRHGLGDMGKHMKQLETHMAQLANIIGSRHKPEQFLSDTIVNLRDQCNVIHLRSRTEYADPQNAY